MAVARTTRYAIAAIRERVRDFDGPVLDFAVGQQPDPAPADLRGLLTEEAFKLLISGTAAGEHDAFCRSAVDMLHRTYGVDVDATAILPTPGGRTAMSFLVAAATRPDDLLVVTEPGYPAMGRIASQLRPRTLAIPLDPACGFCPELTAVPDDAFPRLRFVALNYPNNPTGAVLHGAGLDALADRLEPGTILFNDATYGPLTFDGSPWSLLASAADHRHRLRLLELHSLSKLYGLGPQPVAFLAGHPETIAELRELSEFAWSDQSSLAIRIATWCMADGDHLETVREIYRQRLERLFGAVTTLGFEPYRPAGGMYLICKAPRTVGGRLVGSAAEAADRLLEAFSLAVVPWDVAPDGYLRFSGRYRPEDLEDLLGLGHDGPIVTT